MQSYRFYRVDENKTEENDEISYEAFELSLTNKTIIKKVPRNQKLCPSNRTFLIN